VTSDYASDSAPDSSTDISSDTSSLTNEVTETTEVAEPAEVTKTQQDVMRAKLKAVSQAQMKVLDASGVDGYDATQTNLKVMHDAAEAKGADL
jgi:hypothetical protein